MTLGEKLTSLECIIYEFSNERLDSSCLDPELAEIVMGKVYRRFQENAYHASLLNQLNAERPNTAQSEALGQSEPLRQNTAQPTEQ